MCSCCSSKATNAVRTSAICCCTWRPGMARWLSETTWHMDNMWTVSRMLGKWCQWNRLNRGKKWGSLFSTNPPVMFWWNAARVITWWLPPNWWDLTEHLYRMSFHNVFTMQRIAEAQVFILRCRPSKLCASRGVMWTWQRPRRTSQAGSVDSLECFDVCSSTGSISVVVERMLRGLVDAAKEAQCQHPCC